MAEVFGTLVFLGLVYVMSLGFEKYINSGKPSKVKSTIKNLLSEDEQDF